VEERNDGICSHNTGYLRLLALVLYYTGFLGKLLNQPKVTEVQLPYKKRKYLLTKA